MIPVVPENDMDWLPGLGRQSHSGPCCFPSELETGLNTQVTDPKIDEVEFSIVCNDCGKHFWSRFKAKSYAALTAHVLHEEHTSPSSPVTVPESPTANSAYFPGTNSLSRPAIEAKASTRICSFGYEHSGDSKDETSVM